MKIPTYPPGSPAAESLKAIAREIMAELNALSVEEIFSPERETDVRFRKLALIGRMLGWFEGIEGLEDDEDDET